VRVFETATRTIGLASSLLLAAGPAAAFQAGEVLWAPGACDTPPCFAHEVDAGAGTTVLLAGLDPAPGQIVFKPDLSAAYVSQFTPDTIVRITPAGAVSTWATAIDGPTGLLITSGGTFLVASYSDGAVYDATAVYEGTGGSSLSQAPVFATGFQTPRNLVELSTGEILLADQTRRAVYDISAGGGADFSAAPAYASGFSIGVYDLLEDGAGRIYLSTRVGVYDITGGGDFTGASAHATGRRFMGLTVDGAGRLLATEFETGAVFDITAADDYSAAAPVATVPGGLGDSALDTVPEGSGGDPPSVPLLGPLAYGVLASLLAATGAVSRSR
jgi:hypothetical protein